MKLLAFMNICSSYSRETFAAELWNEMRGDRADIIKGDDSEAAVAAVDELMGEVMAALHSDTRIDSSTFESRHAPIRRRPTW